MAPINTTFNAFYAAIVDEVSKTLDAEGHLTEEIATLLQNLKSTSKASTKKPKKKGSMNGYNLFMKENRSAMAEKKPDLSPQEMTKELAKLWNEQDESKKSDYNTRAKALGSDSSSSESETEKKPVVDKKKKPVVEKKKKPVVDKKKSPMVEKKKPPPPPEDSDDEEDEASSDIDI